MIGPSQLATLSTQAARPNSRSTSSRVHRSSWMRLKSASLSTWRARTTRPWGSTSIIQAYCPAGCCEYWSRSPSGSRTTRWG